MISVSIGDFDIDLPKSMSLKIKAVNPLFSSNNWNEAYSYSIAFPRSNRNFINLYERIRESENERIVIRHFGIVFITGKVVEITRSQDSYKVNLQDDGMDARKNLAKTPFSDLSLPTVNVFDATDSIQEKLDKWKQLMTETTIDTPPNEGAFKFPKIFTQGYKDEGDPNNQLNAIHQFNGSIVNAFSRGSYLQNTGVPNTNSSASEKNWFMTVAPCIRIQYLLERVCEHIGIDRIISELDEIPEFNALVNFNGQVLDALATDGTNTYNVHGESFDLKKFLPETNMIELFKLLTEKFGAFYVTRGNTLHIYLRKNTLRAAAVNYSKYAAMEYTDKVNDSVEFKLSYSISEDETNLYRGQQYSDHQTPLPYIYPYQSFLFGDNSENNSKDISINHVPLVSNYFTLSGSYINYAAYVSAQPEDQYGYLEFSAFNAYRAEIKSDEFPDENVEVSKTFNTVVVRGVYPTKELVVDSGGNITGENTIDHLYSYNYNQLQIADDTLANFSNYILNFGKSSIYYQGKDNLFDEYHSEYYHFLKSNRSISKRFQFPIHVLLNILTWKQPKHVIIQRNLSFEGIVKELYFELTNQAILSTSIEYLVSTKSNT